MNQCHISFSSDKLAWQAAPHLPLRNGTLGLGFASFHQTGVQLCILGTQAEHLLYSLFPI